MIASRLGDRACRNIVWVGIDRGSRSCALLRKCYPHQVQWQELIGEVDVVSSFPAHKCSTDRRWQRLAQWLLDARRMGRRWSAGAPQDPPTSGGDNDLEYPSMSSLAPAPTSQPNARTRNAARSKASRPGGGGDQALLVELLNALLRERWLPIGLRTLLVHELPALRSKMESGRAVDSELAEQLGLLYQAASGYGDTVQRSETVRLLLELGREFGANGAR